MRTAAATERLLAADRPVHLITAGEGYQRSQIAEKLGSAVSTPGFVPQPGPRR